jgi:hypothetical protein
VRPKHEVAFFNKNELVAPALLYFIPFCSRRLISVVNWQRRIIKLTKRGGFYGALERGGSERTKDDAERTKDDAERAKGDAERVK